MDSCQGLTKQIGGQAHEVAAKMDEFARGMISAFGATLFEELGLYYIGLVDGHNVEDLVTILHTWLACQIWLSWLPPMKLS